MRLITRENFVIKILEFKVQECDIQDILRDVATRGKTVDFRK